MIQINLELDTITVRNLLTCKRVKAKINGCEDNISAEEVMRAVEGVIATSWGYKRSENLATRANIPELGKITAGQDY